jgi:Flp pilus assembly protein TadD
MKVATCTVFAVLALTSSAAWSIGGDDSKSVDPTYREAVRLIDDQRYADAISRLKQVVTRDPVNADAYNYLGYAARKLGDRVAAFTYYRMALQLDPRHLGANEYLGELYVETGDLQGAETQLARVGEICRGTCEAYTDLEDAIRRGWLGKVQG